MRIGKAGVAVSAQLGAQSLTGLALVFVVLSGNLFEACFLVAALAVTFRRDRRPHDRALSNFAAATLAWGGVLSSLLDSITDPTSGPFGLQPATLILLVSAILFAFAGAFFWLTKSEDES